MDLTAVVLAVTIYSTFVTMTNGQTRAQCSKRSCYPATGDLLVGREKTLFASSTCGLRGPERFCMVSNLKEQEECSYCDSRNISTSAFSHLPKYMLSNFDGQDNKWWQSENGKENVYLQLDLKSEFHFTHLIMTFRSFRPAGMLIERSFDSGKNWHVYRYFADNCDKVFPRIPKGEPQDIDDVICTEKFSVVEPSTGGELIFSALKSQAPIKDPYSAKVQNLLKLTNLRINFTKLHTLGDDILDPRPEIKRKYYYAVYDLVIRGSCSCYGHAEQCLPLPGQKYIPGMVYGQCNCTHHTTGDNCERCEDGYEDVEWKPAFNDNINECKKCNCNGHSTKCHFDMAVYIASGNKSGGVCDNCTHNTVGRNCESCRPLHYQDPDKDFSEPDACIPCNCDFEGGVSGGECEAKNDPSKGLIAGRCICKANVEGNRCDRCKPGYFRLSASNFEGCEACGCSALGTLRPCNPNNGKCTCKRYVQGEKCDRCLDGYWGLSNSLSGCQECACDVGGSYDNQCEKITGQCRCRKGINGRKCDRVKPGHYFPLPDHLVYESEEAQAIKVSEVRRQQPPLDGKASWTGEGFLEVESGSSVVYTISNVPHTTDYLVLLRYETKDNNDWDAVVTISRDDGQSLTSGICSRIGEVEHYRNKTVRLRYNQRFVYVPGSLCLEKGVTYNVRVKFVKTSPFGSDSVFTDSVVLMPDHNKVSIFQGPDGLKRKQQYDLYRCKDNHQSLPRPVLSQICENLIFSVSAVIFDGSLTCQCDPTGTKRDINGSLICDNVGGQCLCKPNVIGQRCDRCAPGSFGFGPSGCAACDCDARGSVDLFCNIVNGKCPCHSWASGRQCSLCPPKKWGFPSCYDCQCYGHADSCNAETGECLDCQHNTVGWRCDQCAVGYYGIATTGTPNDCSRCQCPGGSSGNKFSKTCIIDTSTTPASVLCNACEKGYAGKQCDKCADGYFGSPLVPGGSCKPCVCNNNIDPFARGNCDHVTGECLKCLDNTAGFNCERCAPGYHGSALARNCTKCICNKQGTTPGFEDTCNDDTGQCNCLPNVEGLQCNRCVEGYWDLDSGQGCKRCDCCEPGSKKTMCDQANGQCHCKAGFGGPRCCDCENGYWGYPPDGCNPCDCNPAGSLDLQCNRGTGACQCKVGHVGPKCDMCAVDTSGKMPKCEICGECYYSWKGTLADLTKNVTFVIGQASNLSVSSTGGGIYAYEKELASLAEKLKRVREILDSQVINKNSTRKVEEELQMIDSRLLYVANVTELVTKSVADTIDKTSAANNEIDRLRKMLEDLLKKADDLRKEITSIREKEFKGAFDAIRKNQERSRAAEAKVNGSMDNIRTASGNRKYIQSKLDGPPSFNEKKQANRISLDDIFRRIRILTNQSMMLSAMVCGTPRDMCGCLADECDSCGGPGCNGTKRLAMEAMEMAMKAENALRMKEAKANATLEHAKHAEMKVNMSRDAAMMSLESALESQTQARNASNRMDQLIRDILEFLAMPLLDTSNARQNVERILNMTLSVGPEQIEKLAEDIDKALKSISGIDEILEQTKGNLSRADDLKTRAEKAREKALGVQSVINNVTQALNMTAKAQQMATAAIDQATADTDKAEEIVAKLFPSIDELEKKVSEAENSTKATKEDLVPIKAEFDENAKNLAMAEDSTRTAHNESKQAIIEAEYLKKLFEQARGRIENKVGQVKNATERVKIFKQKAGDLKQNLVNKIIRMNEIEKETLKYDDLIAELKQLRDRMTAIRTRLVLKVDYMNTCNPATDPLGPP